MAAVACEIKYVFYFHFKLYRKMTEAQENSSEQDRMVSADRLYELSKRIVEIAGEPNIAKTEAWVGLNLIAKRAGINDHYELRDGLLALCNRVTSDIRSLDVHNERVREDMLESIEPVKSMFNHEIARKETFRVVGDALDGVQYERFLNISDRLQTAGQQEASESELKDALETARRALDAYQETKKLSPQVVIVLKHYLQQIEIAFQQHADFGDDLFWKNYKSMFATFVQVHSTLDKTNLDESVHKKCSKQLFAMLQSSLKGLGIAADATTLTGAATGFLSID